MAELAESSKRLLHLLERTPPIAVLRKAVFEEQPDVPVRNPNRGAKLMREHMQDVVDINRHAIAERTTHPCIVRHAT